MASEFITLGHETPQEDLDVLVGLVYDLRLRGPESVIVEIGCWTGMSTVALAKTGSIVHSIDHFHGNPEDRLGKLAQEYGTTRIVEAFCHNLKPWLFKTVHLHIGTSAFYAAIWPFLVDVVFIDGDHRYESVKRDISVWWPHVKEGGVICGHDYPNFEGVRRAVDEWNNLVQAAGVARGVVEQVRECDAPPKHKSNVWWCRKV